VQEAVPLEQDGVGVEQQAVGQDAATQLQVAPLTTHFGFTEPPVHFVGCIVGSASQKHVEVDVGQVGATQSQAPDADEAEQVGATRTASCVPESTHTIGAGSVVEEQVQGGVPVQKGVQAHVVELAPDTVAVAITGAHL